MRRSHKNKTLSVTGTDRALEMAFYSTYFNNNEQQFQFTKCRFFGFLADAKLSRFRLPFAKNWRETL